MTRRAMLAAAVLPVFLSTDADRRIYRDWFGMIEAKAQGQWVKGFLCAVRLQARIEEQGIPARWAKLHAWLCRHPGGEEWPIRRDPINRAGVLRFLRGESDRI